MSASPTASPRALRTEAKSHLRALRRRLRVTQQELANSSEALSTPISREFIANLESAGLPGTVRKFFTYSWLTGADLGLLQEFVASDEGMLDEQPALDDARDVCRQLSDAGKHRQAVTVALSASREAQARGADETYAQLLLTAAVAANRGGLWRLGREMAEEAHSSGFLPAANEARATLLIAQSLNAMHRTLMALRIMSTIDQALFDQKPELGASYWHDMAVFYNAIERYEEALEAVEKGLVFYAQTNRTAACAVLVGLRAILTARLQSPERALDIANNALERIEATNDIASKTRVLVNAGLVALMARKLDSARKMLTEARDLAEESRHDLSAFEARLGLCELAYLDKRRAEARRQLKELRRDALRVRLDRDTKSYFENLADMIGPRR